MKSALMLLLLVIMAAACTPAAAPVSSPTPTAAQPAPSTPTPVATPTPAGQAINLDLLKNFTYKLESAGGLQVTLVDGSFKTNDPGSPATLSGQLVKSALGDLNGDGVLDAAVTLAVNTGGSGTFHELLVILAQDGKAVQAADLFLEDRLGEKSLSIADGLITLEAVRHTANDPLCCPSENAVTVYRYQGGKLVVVSDQVLR